MPAANIAARILRNIGFASPQASADDIAGDGNAAASSSSPPAGMVDYELIYAAVMENDRGRWFLSEYARRNRVADTEAVLDAIGRLATSDNSSGTGGPAERSPTASSTTASSPYEPSPAAAFANAERLRAELTGMADAIARIKSRLAPGAPEDLDGSPAPDPFASLARTNGYLKVIMDAAEQVQDVAWTMRQQSIAAALCDRLDLCADELLAACTRLDVARQSVREIVNVLRYLDVRLHAVTGAGTEPAAPTAPIVPDIPATPNVTAGAMTATMPIGPATSVVPTAMRDEPEISVVGPGLPITPVPAQAPSVPAPGASAREGEPPTAAVGSPLFDTNRFVFIALRESRDMGIGCPDPIDTMPLPVPKPANKPSGIGRDDAANDTPWAAEDDMVGGKRCPPAPLAPFSEVEQNIDLQAAAATPPAALAFEQTPLSSSAVHQSAAAFPDDPAKTVAQPAPGPEYVAEAPAMVAAEAANPVAAGQPVTDPETTKVREGSVAPATMPPAAARNPDPDFAALFADVLALSEEERIALFT